MIETRVEKHVSFSDFIATESRNVPFSKEDLLQMAIDQVNDEKPLTIITKSSIFIISAESIADFLSPQPPQAVPEDGVLVGEKPIVPELPGEVTAKTPA